MSFPPIEGSQIQKIHSGLAKIYAHDCKRKQMVMPIITDIPTQLITLEEAQLICHALFSLEILMSQHLDELHSMILAHSGMSLDQRFENLKRHWDANGELFVIREMTWRVGIGPDAPRKRPRSWRINNDYIVRGLEAFQVWVASAFYHFRLIEKDLISANTNAWCLLHAASVRLVFATYHHKLTSFLFHSGAMTAVFSSSVLKDFSGVLLGVLHRPQTDLRESAPWSIPSLPPSPPLLPKAIPPAPTSVGVGMLSFAAEKVSAKQPIPEEATCFICWSEIEPDYEDDEVIQQLEALRVLRETRRRFPDHRITPNGPESLTNAHCCAATYHRACFLRSLTPDRLLCPHCQRPVDEATIIQVFNWKTADLSCKTHEMHDILFEERLTSTCPYVMSHLARVRQGQSGEGGIAPSQTEPQT